MQPIVSNEKIETDFTKYGMFDLEKDIDGVNASLNQTTNKLANLLDPNAKTPAEKLKAIESANKLYDEYRVNPHIIKDNRQRQLLEQMDNLDNEQYKLITKKAAAKKQDLVLLQIQKNL